jgi:hypothetical protein
VLSGLPALVAAISPRFTLAANDSDVPPAFHPSSPAGRLLSHFGSTLSLEFSDPYLESGGFGASTAQFALSYLAIQGRRPQAPETEEWREVWTLYRKLLSDQQIVRSGADLVGQWCGGVTLFDPDARRVESFSNALDWTQLLVFSATRQKGRKVRTHDHLQTLAHIQLPFGELGKVLGEGIEALKKKDAASFGASWIRYAEVLRNNNLEADATHEDRRAMQYLPGVIGVKGAGALQADAVICLLDPNRANRADIIRKAEKRGLLLVADGLRDLSGVKCHET